MNDNVFIRDLRILNSYSKDLKITEVTTTSQSPLNEQPILEVRNATLPSFVYTSALTCKFYNGREGQYTGSIIIRTNSTKKALNEFTVQYEYMVINGTIATESPIYFCLKPSIRSKIITIPIRMKNLFSVPVYITHIGIPKEITSLLSISNQSNETLFSTNHDIKCFANPNEFFSPLNFVFHANRYRPRM